MLRVYTNPVFYRHFTGPGHPESPDRLDNALAGLRRAGAEPLLSTKTSPDVETERLIAKVHSAEYARQFEAACVGGFTAFHSFDNAISSESYTAAVTAVATALTAADAIWRSKEISRAFVVARPPGHHAERVEAMGFCFFNTIACVAESLRELPGIERIFILDWDVHHGNGTQKLFEDRDDIFYTSLHRFPFYPGSGAATEIGTGRGEGYTRNIPLDEGGGDAVYLDTMEKTVLPLIDEYKPHAILVSAGFDPHVLDPLGGMRVSEWAFGTMTKMLVAAAQKHCDGRVLSLLEGGYDPEGLASSVMEHVVVLGGL